MKIKKEQVEEALASLEKSLIAGDDISKASEDDLDNPEGGELEPGHMKNKMSDKAPAPVKAKKSLAKEDEDVSKADDEAEEGEEGEDMLQKKLAAKKAKKSFSEELPEEIQTKIDVSEFLKSLVDHTGDTIDSLREYVAKSDVAHEARYTDLVDAVEDVQKSQAKIGVVLKAICERIGVIESQPARPAKSDTVQKSNAKQVERSFDSGLAEEGEEKQVMFKSLSQDPVIAKSQVANALCDLVRKGDALDLDVIGFESGGYIRPELVTKLKTVLN